MSKNISQRKRLAAIFASFSVLIVGTASLLESMSIDYYSVLDTIKKIIPAAFILGGMGWVMGMILDKPKKKTKVGMDYSNLLLNKSIQEDIDTTIADVGDMSIEDKDT